MIDSVLAEELRKRYNPDGSELRNLQLRMLDMLIWIDRFCKNNGITWWITAGTLLGAVRHGGFIPWDDDVDIAMPQKDFERFVNLFHEDERYALQTEKSDFFYTSPYAKLRDKFSYIEEKDKTDANFKYRGIFIDVFSVEHCPFWLSKLALHYRWKLSLYAKRNNLGSWRRSCFCVRKAILYGLIKNTRWLLHNYNDGPLRLSMGTGFLEEERYEDDIFPLDKLMFENHSLPVPGDYDRYLKRIYGDYMQLPSSDHIHPHSLRFRIYAQ